MIERRLDREDLDSFCQITADALARLANVSTDDARIVAFFDDLCGLCEKYWQVDYRNYN